MRLCHLAITIIEVIKFGAVKLVNFIANELGKLVCLFIYFEGKIILQGCQKCRLHMFKKEK